MEHQSLRLVPTRIYGLRPGSLGIGLVSALSRAGFVFEMFGALPGASLRSFPIGAPIWRPFRSCQRADRALGFAFEIFGVLPCPCCAHAYLWRAPWRSCAFRLR